MVDPEIIQEVVEQEVIELLVLDPLHYEEVL